MLLHLFCLNPPKLINSCLSLKSDGFDICVIHVSAITLLMFRTLCNDLAMNGKRIHGF
jgi:hypothetical protein